MKEYCRIPRLFGEAIGEFCPSKPICPSGRVSPVLSAVMVKVCRERIHEIKKGEEDDLSQY